MKYEVCRFFDASRFEVSIGTVGCLDREGTFEIGDELTPRPEEYMHELEKELYTGFVLAIVKKGEFDNNRQDADYRIVLGDVDIREWAKRENTSIDDVLSKLSNFKIDVRELSERYNISEDIILSKFLHLTSEARDRILAELAEITGGDILLDDIYDTDIGQVGIIWFSGKSYTRGGNLIVYDFNKGDIITRKRTVAADLSLGWGIEERNYFLRGLRDLMKEGNELILRDLLSSLYLYSIVSCDILGRDMITRMGGNDKEGAVTFLINGEVHGADYGRWRKDKRLYIDNAPVPENAGFEICKTINDWNEQREKQGELEERLYKILSDIIVEREKDYLEKKITPPVTPFVPIITVTPHNCND